MAGHKKISAFSIVKNNTVSKNGDLLFGCEQEKDAADFFLAAYSYFAINYPKFYKMDNLSKLGILATEILLKDSFQTEGKDPYNTGIVLSNSNSSLDTDKRYYDTVANIASPALFVYTLPNVVIGEICIKFAFKGENAFFIFDSFDADFTTRYVNNLFETTGIETCICGWLDILENDYKAVLFLVEKQAGDKAHAFTEDNLNNIYQTNTWKKQH
ncbi:MAG: hypothetical protein ABI861_10285 [Panacibacter sp.]